jgi:spermidine synthase
VDDSEIRRQPGAVAAILRDTHALGFDMASEPRVGSLLAVLAASKPGGRVLELGTGTGHGAAWLLAGMDAAATLDTVDSDANVVAVAQRHLPGGVYVIDDLLPQPNWPEGHAPRVPVLIDDIERRDEFATVRLAWASGLMLVVRKAGSAPGLWNDEAAAVD